MINHLVNTRFFPYARYWLSANETLVAEGGIIILDTQTGDYLLDYYLDNKDWRKGNFSETHRSSKGLIQKVK